VKRYQKVKIQNSEAVKYRWAFKMFFISISMSIFLGFINQTLLSSMGAIVATIGILFFIFLSVIFDMIGIAAASADLDTLLEWKQKQIKGAKVGVKLCVNSEKVCSFCADVVGDICSTLCGTAGACVIASMTANLRNFYIITIITILVSALIAGLMVFFKAIVKTKTIRNSNKIILKMGVIFERIMGKEKIK